MSYEARSNAMKLVIYSDPPIPLADLIAVQQMLAKEHLICSAFTPEELDVYDCFSFLRQKDLYATETCVVLDRNIFSRIVSLARGEGISGRTKGAEDAYRIAAAALAFFQCCDALIEPCMPLLEQASHDNSPATAGEELRLFRKADNIHPRHFADIALGKNDRLEPSLIEQSTPEEQDTGEGSPKPMWWKLNYALALKLALLELEPIGQRIKLERLLRWIHEDYAWSASAVLFATLYLSPRRKRGMLKRLRGKDSRAALDGGEERYVGYDSSNHVGDKVPQRARQQDAMGSVQSR